MQPPSKREAKGFDIVVWKDKDGEIVGRAFTTQGHKALKAFVNEYRKGDIVSIYCHPDEFIAELPKTILVGILSERSKKVVPMNKNHLH
jgi:hypothetical protein